LVFGKKNNYSPGAKDAEIKNFLLVNIKEKILCGESNCFKKLNAYYSVEGE
jgi:hypothetical protein